MTEQLKVEFPGKEIKLHRLTLVIPPLGMAAYRKHQAFKKLNRIVQELDKIQKDKNYEISEEVFQDMTELTYLAAKRNYDDITLEQIEDALDFDSFLEVMQILVTQNEQAQTEMKKQIKNIQRQSV